MGFYSNGLFFNALQGAEKRSDVVLIMSDVIFPASDVVFPISYVVFVFSLYGMELPACAGKCLYEKYFLSRARFGGLTDLISGFNRQTNQIYDNKKCFENSFGGIVLPLCNRVCLVRQ